MKKAVVLRTVVCQAVCVDYNGDSYTIRVLL